MRWGEGVGYLAARTEVNDLTGKACLDGIGNALNTGSPAVIQGFKDANYTAAEVLHDLKTVLEGNPNLPSGKMFRDGQNPGKLAIGDAGAVGEVGFAARKRRGGATPIDISADEGTGVFAGKKVDQHWSDHIYQVGLSSDTIKGKLQKLDSLAPGVKQALDTLALEKIAGRMPQNARFKFGYTVQGDWVPDPQGGGYFAQLNSKLAELYAPGVPPQVFTAADFELLDLATP